MKIETGVLKLLIGWTVVFLFRLIPFRPPNFEPMLATMMPFSKRYGALGTFLFGFLGVVLFDAATAGWGTWTWVTALCYGGLGVASFYYFQNREPTRANFIGFSVVGTLAYDAVTMFIGPLFNAQPLALAISGQIPFTIMHLIGAVVYAAVLSPALYRWVVQSDVLVLKFSIPLHSR